MNGNILLYCWIKTCHGWEVRVEFFQKPGPESAQLAKSTVLKKDINVLHVELGHPLEVITCATGKAMSLNLTGMLNPCKVVTWKRQKWAESARELLIAPKF